jgi:hypothetical protein
MKTNQAGIIKRLVAAMLVAAAIVGVSALSMQTPTHNPTALKSIQTDRATTYANFLPDYRTSFVERVPAMTGESKALTENLKLVAAAF